MSSYIYIYSSWNKYPTVNYTKFESDFDFFSLDDKEATKIHPIPELKTENMNCKKHSRISQTTIKKRQNCWQKIQNGMITSITSTKTCLASSDDIFHFTSKTILSYAFSKWKIQTIKCQMNTTVSKNCINRQTREQVNYLKSTIGIWGNRSARWKAHPDAWTEATQRWAPCTWAACNRTQEFRMTTFIPC